MNSNRPFSRALRLSVVVTTAALCLGGTGLRAAPVKAGFAERDISPEIGMERPGGYGKGYHQAFHDPCKARAAVFDDGEKVVALVGLDALIVREPQVAEARRRISEATGIVPEAVLIGASHSHSSGPTGMVLPGEYDHADASVQELAYEQSSMADPEYLETMVAGIAEAVIEAYESRAELSLGFGRGEEGSISFNRRWRMQNGLTYTHPRPGNPGMVEPAGPIDPEVGVIGAWDGEGRLVGCVVNFACHATTSPPGISANFPWGLEKVLRGTFGDEVVVVFLNGNSGDVTQVDNASPIRPTSGADAAMQVGGAIGAEAVKVLLGLKARLGSKAKVDHRVRVLEIPRRPPSAERLARSREMVAEKPTQASAIHDWIWAKEIVMLQALIDKEPVAPVEVQVVQVGPAVFVSNPAEYFCEFGLQQKAASPFPFTWPVSLANGCVGYVPTSEAMGPSGGGYETRLTSYSNLVPEAGDLIRDAGIDLAKELEPGPVPPGEPQPPFVAPWNYGDMPPELD
jgi:neutral ceramidase